MGAGPEDLVGLPWKPVPEVSRELKLRIVSALVLGVIVLALTWFGGYAFMSLWAVAAIMILLEFSKITVSSQQSVTKLTAMACLVLVIGAWFSSEKQLALIFFVSGLAILCIWELVIARTMWAASGLLYAALPFFTITELRGNENGGLLAIILLFACVWGADVFAYFAGRSIGGPKLAPKISPNKTWSGFFGSLFGAVLLSFAVVFGAGYRAGLALLVLVVLLAVISQIGDLVESSIKRKFNVKDSGSIIPGHGGVLDRIDGLVFAGVLFWLILWSVQTIGEVSGPFSQIFVNYFLIT